MNNDLILDAMGLVDDRFVNEFAEMDMRLTANREILTSHPDARRHLKWAVPAAACICALTVTAVLLSIRWQGQWGGGIISTLPFDPLATGSTPVQSDGYPTESTPSSPVPDDELKLIPTEDGNAFAVQSGAGLSGRVKIPGEYDGRPVIGIMSGAFAGCDGITDVVIPGTVRFIGDRAFADCDGLTELVFTEGLEEIGKNAFSGCGNINMVILPESLRSVGEGAFDGLGSGSYSKQSKGTYLSSRGSEHYLLISISEGRIADDCRVIASGAFTSYSGKELTVPAGVRCISPLGLSGAGKLEEVSFEDGAALEYIGDGFLSVCPNLYSVTMEIGEDVLGSAAFSGCPMLRSVTLTGEMKHLPENTFLGCTTLLEIRLPDTLERIEKGAVGGCNSLKRIAFGGTARQWESVIKADGWCDVGRSFTVVCDDRSVEYSS